MSRRPDTIRAVEHLSLARKIIYASNTPNTVCTDYVSPTPKGTVVHAAQATSHGVADLDETTTSDAVLTCPPIPNMSRSHFTRKLNSSISCWPMTITFPGTLFSVLTVAINVLAASTRSATLSWTSSSDSHMFGLVSQPQCQRLQVCKNICIASLVDVDKNAESSLLDASYMRPCS